MNPFKEKQPVQQPNRNSFDLSFDNNLTTTFGKLVPVFVKEVIPGDSFEIDTQFGLRMMPTVFPVQSKVRADIHFFYVRNRNLWKHWQDFISGQLDTKEHPFPYLKIEPNKQNRLATGSLLDYLGVPTSVVSRGYGEDLTLQRQIGDYNDLYSLYFDEYFPQE